MKKNSKNKKAQVMILTVLILGGTILGATTVAGLLMLYQIRQATDLGRSTQAIFAADTAIEWGLYQYYGGTEGPPVLSNGANFSTTCYDNSQNEVNCRSTSTTSIVGIGRSGDVRRAFLRSF